MFCIFYFLQRIPSESLEATVAAVNTITESTATEDAGGPPIDQIIRDHIDNIGTAITIDPVISSNSLVTDDRAIINDPIIPTDSIVTSDSIVTTGHMIPSDSLLNITPMDSTTTNDQPVITEHLVTNQIVTTDSSVSTEDNVLTSITGDRLTIDTIALLQHLQPSGMVVSTDNDCETIPLILDDVTFLNIGSSENMQIISLTQLDSPVIQTQVGFEVGCKVFSIFKSFVIDEEKYIYQYLNSIVPVYIINNSF